MNISFLRDIPKDQKYLLFFSGGKESIVSLDLLREYNINFECIFLYYIPDLIYKKEILSYYENRFDIKIIQRPHPFFILWNQKQVFGIQDAEKKFADFKQKDLKFGSYCKLLKKELNYEWGALGYKKLDSVNRARVLYKHGPIDNQNKYIYPVAYFTHNDIYNYIEKRKLKLPFEYSCGFKGEISTPFSKDILNHLKEYYIEDYEKILNMFPQLESVLIK